MTDVIQFPTPQNSAGDISATGTQSSSGMTPARRTRQSQKDGTRKAADDGTQKRRYKPRARHCKVCGDEFTPDAKHGRYCSSKCRKKAYRQRLSKGRKPAAAPVANLDMVTCLHCGQTNLITGGKGAKYCSATCRQRAYKARRLATVEAYARFFNIGIEEAYDDVEEAGLKSVTATLARHNWSYSDQARQWIQPAQEMAAAGD